MLIIRFQLLLSFRCSVSAIILSITTTETGKLYKGSNDKFNCDQRHQLAITHDWILSALLHNWMSFPFSGLTLKQLHYFFKTWFISNVFHYKSNILWVQYNEYVISIVDADGLVLYHWGISPHNVDHELMLFHLLMGLTPRQPGILGFKGN